MSTLGRTIRGLARYCLMGLLLAALLVSAGLWYVTTDSFQRLVRGRLIAAVEGATGGRVEVGSFHVVPLRFEVEVRDLTIHGRESAHELPLFHVDSLSAVVNLPSIFGATIGFHSLTLDHPVVHVIFYPDGSTNQPAPPQTSTVDFTQLFAISVDRLELRHGELLWQDEHVPLEFVSNDVFANLNYSFLRRRYSGNLSVGKAETQFDGLRPVAWSGQAEFWINRQEIRIRSLRAVAEGSKVQASGTITNLRDPIFKGDYDLRLDLRQASAVAREPRIKSGSLELRGSGTWSNESFVTTGNFELDDAAWQDRSFAGKNLSADGNFMVDPQKILMLSVKGHFLRGDFSSDMEVSGWRSVPKVSKRAKQETQRGTIKIKAKDVSLSELLASLGPQFQPINRLKFAGNISGTSDIHWKDWIGKAEITAAIDISRPNRPTPGLIPLAASTRLTYRAQSPSVQIGDFYADTPASHIRASGDLASALNLSFSSTDLREWQPVLSALFPAGLPLTIRGRAAFRGTASGAVPNVTMAGNLQLEDFDTLIRSKTSATTVQWDSLNAGLQVSPRALTVRDAVLSHSNTTVKIDGTASLQAWNTAPAAPLRFHIDAENADAAWLGPLLQQDVAMAGTINARAEVSGTIEKLQVRGNVNWQAGSADGYAFDTASAQVATDGSRVSFENLNLIRQQARVTGNGTYDLSAKNFQLKLAGTNFDLHEVPQLEESRINVSGKLDFTAEASGTPSRPDLTAHFHLRNVILNDEQAGDYFLDATTQGPDLRLNGHSSSEKAELTIAGNVRLREQWPAHIDFNFARLDVDPFIESYLGGHVTGHSSVAGNLALEGPLRNPRQLTLTGNLTDFSANIQNVKLRNQGPMRFTVSAETLRVDSLHLVSDNTDFLASGSMQLSGERALNFSASGQVGLRLVRTYDPDLSGSGTLSGEARVTGTVSTPLIKGKLQVENAGISDINLPSALSDMNGSFAFNQNQITIENLSAHTGGGTVNFAGHAEVVGKQLNFDLSADASSVRLRYPPGVSSTADATLHWTGSSNGSLLSGDITVTKVGVTPGFDFGAYLERSLQSASLPQTDPVLNKIRLDLHVVTTPELQMQTSVLRLRGEADLRVRGNAAKPVLLGRADVFEGEAYFNGTKYRLERGGVTFGGAANNPAATVPFVDLEATTRVRDYDITLSITGPADRPKLNYRSEPPLPTNDIIGLLAFGQTTEESAQLQQTSQSAFSQQASNAMLAAALNATLNNRTQRLFGNSRIKIDPQGLETETSPTQSGPAVTIEQQVKDNLTLTYTTNVAQTSQQIIRAEYNVSRNVSVVAIRDQNGVVSFDVKIRRRKR